MHIYEIYCTLYIGTDPIDVVRMNTIARNEEKAKTDVFTCVYNKHHNDCDYITIDRVFCLR